MPRGGFRAAAGTGRPKGAKDKVPRKRGGKQAVTAQSAEAPGETTEPPAVEPGKLSPVDYMLQVMNDPKADPGLRSRMAIAAAPFVHGQAKKADEGKKAAKVRAAKDVEKGKFAPSLPPKLRAVK